MGKQINITSPDIPEVGFDYATTVQVVSWIMVGISIPGVISNVLTILVFLKLGFKDTINMIYMALAASDLCTVTTVALFGIFNTTVVKNVLNYYHISTDPPMIAVAFGVWPQFAFSRTTALLTAWISFQRCMCTVLPVRGKFLATPTVTRATIAVALLACCCPIISLYSGLHQVWVFDGAANITNFNLYRETGIIDTVMLPILYGNFYPFFSWMIVVGCTSCLIYNLRARLRWRQQINNTGRTFGVRANQVSAKEHRISKTVSIIAGIFIVLSLPLFAHALAISVIPGYFAGGSLANLFQANMSICMLFTELNSSVNIFAFATQGHRFRAALMNMMPRWLRIAAQAH